MIMAGYTLSSRPPSLLFLPKTHINLPKFSKFPSKLNHGPLNKQSSFLSYYIGSSQQKNNDSWEAPHSGYGSEYDEDEESDKEEEEEEEEEEETCKVSKSKSSQTIADEYDELVREVEMLLSPEEKTILQENELPDYSKISTMKWSPFHTLTLSGQIPYMDKLLEYGTDIDSVDKDGYTAFHKAIIGKKEAVISHLLRKGANPHVGDKDGITPLHYAVQVGAMQTVKLLIKYKVDVNAVDKDGWTPLHVAMQSRSREIGKVLLVNGADKTRKNKDGKTPLDISLCYGKDFKSYELAKLLKIIPANRNQ